MNSPTSAAERAGWLRLSEAATPAERWKGAVYWSDGAFPVGPYTRDEAQAKADAALIAAYRAAVPRLIADVERLEAQHEAEATSAYQARGRQAGKPKTKRE